MIKIEEVVLDLLANHLFNKNIDSLYLEDLTKEQWEDVYYYTCRHNVTALVFDAVDNLGFRPKNYKRALWVMKVDAIEKHYDKTVEVVDEFRELLSKHNIQMMLIKGLGICRFYPNPRHRTMSDIDIYLYGDHDKAVKILEEELGIKTSCRVKDHHSKMNYKGLLIENHYDFIDTNTYKDTVESEKLLKELAAKGNEPLLHLLFNVYHLASHFAGEVISLRHLLDWYFLWQEYADKVDIDEFYKIVDKAGKRRFCNGLNGVIIRFFGLSSGVFEGYVADEKLEEKMCKNILNPELEIEGKERVLVTFNRFLKNRWKYKLIYPRENVLMVLVKKFVIWLKNLIK